MTSWHSFVVVVVVSLVGGGEAWDDASCRAKAGESGYDPICVLETLTTYRSYGAAFCRGESLDSGGWVRGACDEERRLAGDDFAHEVHEEEEDDNANAFLVLVFLGVGLFMGTATLFPRGVDGPSSSVPLRDRTQVLVTSRETWRPRGDTRTRPTA